MARRSSSSSASKGNGHATAPLSAREPITTREHADGDSDDDSVQHPPRNTALPSDPSLFPNGRRSLSLIGLQAFFLGFTLAAGSIFAIWLLQSNRPIWRLPTFFVCLSIFHFLEYWITAQFNTPVTRSSSFLLFSNGTAYNVAQSLATLEIIVSNIFPLYQSWYVNNYTIAAGLSLVILGQVVRTAAMAQAGTNFNHTPQSVRKEGHVLVTAGAYRLLRHPSYFGFFWWALGTQILVGNKICLLGYLIALWNFFNRRIKAEEKLLVNFFGEDYEVYRKRTRTGIPFIS